MRNKLQQTYSSHCFSSSSSSLQQTPTNSNKRSHRQTQLSATKHPEKRREEAPASVPRGLAKAASSTSRKQHPTRLSSLRRSTTTARRTTLPRHRRQLAERAVAWPLLILLDMATQLCGHRSWFRQAVLYGPS